MTGDARREALEAMHAAEQRRPFDFTSEHELGVMLDAVPTEVLRALVAERGGSVCPWVVTSSEGTSHCRLAAATQGALDRLRADVVHTVERMREPGVSTSPLLWLLARAGIEPEETATDEH